MRIHHGIFQIGITSLRVLFERPWEGKKPLFDHIGDFYVGDYAAISRYLDRPVYYLHYLEKDVVWPHDAQDICCALHQLGECFH